MLVVVCWWVRVSASVFASVCKSYYQCARVSALQCASVSVPVSVLQCSMSVMPQFSVRVKCQGEVSVCHCQYVSDGAVERWNPDTVLG